MRALQYISYLSQSDREASIVAGAVITLSYALCTFYWVESSPATVHCVTTMGLHIHNLRAMRETSALDRFIQPCECIYPFHRRYYLPSMRKYLLSTIPALLASG